MSGLFGKLVRGTLLLPSRGNALIARCLERSWTPPRMRLFEGVCSIVGVRGSHERDISSLRALGPGGGQISRVVHVSTRAAFGVLRGHSRFLGGYVNPGTRRWE